MKTLIRQFLREFSKENPQAIVAQNLGLVFKRDGKKMFAVTEITQTGKPTIELLAGESVSI